MSTPETGIPRSRTMRATSYAAERIRTVEALTADQAADMLHWIAACEPAIFDRARLAARDEPCMHVGVFAISADRPTEHCWTCGQDIPISQL